jgi:hypothetical protein
MGEDIFSGAPERNFTPAVRRRRIGTGIADSAQNKKEPGILAGLCVSILLR